MRYHQKKGAQKAKIAPLYMKRGFKHVMILPSWQPKTQVTILRKDNDHEMLFLNKYNFA